MRRRASILLLVSLFVGGSLHGNWAWAQASAKPSPPALSGPAATNEEKAEALFLKGKALFAEGKLEEAFSTYRAAFSFKKRSDIAGNLGNAAYKLGKMREAAEYLTYSIM